jgi:ABC-type transport system involved in cytochrome c biogenesis permease subunit
MSTEVLLSVVACGMYAVATALAIAHSRDPAPSRGQDMLMVTGSALVCLLAALAVRGLRTGHFPAFGRFEAGTWYAAAVTAAYLYVGLRREVLRTLSAVVLPWAGTVVVLALAGQEGRGTVPEVVYAPAVGLHVTAAFAGYGLFTLGSLLAAAYLVQDRNLKRKRFGWLGKRLPSLEVLDRTMHELIGPALVLFTVSIGMGVLLAHLYKWGVRWASDPKVLLTAATWVVYAVLFYLRGGADRHGRRVAYVAVAGFALVLAGFVGVHWVARSLHDFGFGGT